METTSDLVVTDMTEATAAHGQYETVLRAEEPESGLYALIAVHDTTLGPAIGGSRMWAYETEDAALEDVCRLSLGMTLKCAMARVPFGGGKGVIVADPVEDKSDELLRAYGRFVDSFEGGFYTGEDVGISLDDVRVMQAETPYLVGTDKGGGDPGPMTAYGVLVGMRTAWMHATGKETLDGATVAVQGLGSVGWSVCTGLADAGAKLIVADLNESLMRRAAADFGAATAAPDAIYDVDADIFAPCALGAVLNDSTIERLRCTVVAGSANNQLAEARHGRMLAERGILYAPDYVINAGGLINVAMEAMPGGYDHHKAVEKTTAIAASLAEVFREADAEVPPSEVADAIAWRRVRETSADAQG